MIIQKTNNCTECASISTLLEDIDCKLKSLGVKLYNNVIFSLNQPIVMSIYIDLLHYKRILTYRLANSDYASTYTTAQIASKVKILKFK